MMILPREAKADTVAATRPGRAMLGTARTPTVALVVVWM